MTKNQNLNNGKVKQFLTWATWAFHDPTWALRDPMFWSLLFIAVLGVVAVVYGPDPMPPLRFSGP